MSRGKAPVWLACILILALSLAACGGNQQMTAQAAASTGSTTVNEGAAVTAAQGTANPGASTSATTAAAAISSKTTAEVVHATGNSAAATQIVLNGDAITVTGEGTQVNGSQVTITAGGTYSLNGTLADGQVIVDAADEEPVVLVLSDVDIHSATSAPIYIANAEEAVILLAAGTTNTVSDGNVYVLPAEGSDEPNAAIFSKANLTIEGSGSLAVDASYNDGIASKDDLTITCGRLVVTAADDGIRGKDSLAVLGGNITVTAEGDGLKADNEEDATKGYVLIENGIINVTAGGDAITAQTDVLITDGEFTLITGGGSTGRIAETASAKGVKGLASVVIDGGTFAIDSADDAIHSNQEIIIHSGAFAIATGDDAVHADASIGINGGDFDITTCYEGIESATITINGGNFHVTSSDDALNVSGGNDSSGMMSGPGRGRPGMGGATGAMPGQDTFTTAGTYYLHINGGYIYVDAAGDGIDINGSVVMTDGVLIVNGPTQNMNGALDYDGSFKITGGYLLAAGSAGMAQAPDTSSTQYAVLLNLSSAVQASTLVHIQNSQGGAILTFAPAKAYQSIVFSSPELTKGTYEVYFGGSATGAATDGLYQGGAYTGGSSAGSITISSIVTQVGGSGRMR